MNIVVPSIFMTKPFQQTRQIILYAQKYIRGKTLDLGAGLAKYRQIIQSKATEYITFDKKPGKNIDVVGDALNLPFSNHTFDTLISTQVLEHIEKPWIMVKEIYRVLKPNGKLIITTPNYQSAWILVEKIVNLLGEVKYQEQHITFFNKKKIELLLEQLKFKNINITTNIFLAPFFAYFGWKVSDCIQKIEDKYFNHPFRFFLFVICEKK